MTPSDYSNAKAGDVLTCASDGYPAPTFSWTDDTGTEVSTSETYTLPSGEFDLTCTATGSHTTPCSASTTANSVTGFALGKIILYSAVA